jgi:diaminohydroxyphosphoribosylaminopyrimidine deaminase/5-amino-6-(5-phosphoribosylamino)uracil reductase
MTADANTNADAATDDAAWMRRALALAERGRGAVEPNPMVGAVIVRDGVVVGEGYHARYGHAHAEVNALAQAGELARGATLYVTLEPCCHFGKTPPCTDAILRAGIARVVAAMADPFPQVSGRGADLLRQAGVAVEVGLCAAQARALNAPYLKLLATGRPFVHAKWAMTLDGKIATRRGDSRWISGPESRQRVHELRGLMDAIMVGAGTVRTDDPLLTARPPGPRTPSRIVLTTTADLPPDCQLLRTAKAVPVLIAHTQELAPDCRARYESAGCELLRISGLAGLLDELGRRRMTNVLVEGGASVLAALLAEGLADLLHVFIAPKLIGGQAALSPVGELGVETMAQTPGLRIDTLERSGADVYIRASPTPSHGA